MRATLCLLLLLFINCNWAYGRWQCYKNWTYIQKMDIHSKETKHTSHEKQHISQNFTVQYNEITLHII
jgi:hypothetical protein